MRWLRSIKRTRTIIDANIVLRYLLDDDKELSEQANILIHSQRCIVTLEVIAEVVYVLSSEIYNVPREEIKEKLIDLSNELIIEKKQIFHIALFTYCEKPKLDFVDCLLYGYQKVGYRVLTFDRKLKNKINSLEKN